MGLLRMPENCGQCLLLLLVGYGLITVFLLVFNLTLLLFYFKTKKTIFSIINGIVASYTSTVVLAWYLIQTYYDPNQKYNSDFELSFPTVLISFLIGSLIFFKNSFKEKRNDLSSNMKAGS
jgi:hypothetical protein